MTVCSVLMLMRVNDGEAASPDRPGAERDEEAPDQQFGAPRDLLDGRDLSETALEAWTTARRRLTRKEAFAAAQRGRYESMDWMQDMSHDTGTYLAIGLLMLSVFIALRRSNVQRMLVINQRQ